MVQQQSFVVCLVYVFLFFSFHSLIISLSFLRPKGRGIRPVQNKNEFSQVLILSENKHKVPSQIIEKDYYLTLILNGIAKKIPYAVFKGGTSLSKCHNVINRFSEDIDITIDTNITQGQKKNLKKEILSIIKSIGLSVENLNEIRSRRSYNKYIIPYKSVLDNENEIIVPTVILETSFAEISFPTERMNVESFVGNFISENKLELLAEYNLETFQMKVQSLNRTLIDKVFAICDYYLTGKIEKHSRHIYDIYKLLPLVKLDDEFKKLIQEVRNVRKENEICPSAKDGVDVGKILKKIIYEGTYKSDYNEITAGLLNENVSYEDAISAIEKIRTRF